MSSRSFAARERARLAAENEHLRSLLRVAWPTAAALIDAAAHIEDGHAFEAGDKPTANPRCGRCGQRLQDLVKRPNPRRCGP